MFMSKFPNLKAETATTVVQPVILGEQSVVDWLLVAEKYSYSYSSILKYCITKKASGLPLDEETVKNIKVCVFDFPPL